MGKKECTIDLVPPPTCPSVVSAIWWCFEANQRLDSFRSQLDVFRVAIYTLDVFHGDLPDRFWLEGMEHARGLYVCVAVPVPESLRGPTFMRARLVYADTVGPYLIQAMTCVVEGSTMVVLWMSKPRFKQWAMTASSEGIRRLYRNPYGDSEHDSMAIT